MGEHYYTVASDEDCTTGYLLAEDGQPTDPDALLGLFVVLAAREWDHVYDPNRLTLSARPARYRYSERQEAMLPAGKRKADSRWWVVSGLDDAEVR